MLRVRVVYWVQLIRNFASSFCRKSSYLSQVYNVENCNFAKKLNFTIKRIIKTATPNVWKELINNNTAIIIKTLFNVGSTDMRCEPTYQLKCCDPLHILHKHSIFLSIFILVLNSKSEWFCFMENGELFHTWYALERIELVP